MNLLWINIYLNVLPDNVIYTHNTRILGKYIIILSMYCLQRKLSSFIFFNLLQFYNYHLDSLYNH